MGLHGQVPGGVTRVPRGRGGVLRRVHSTGALAARPEAEQAAYAGGERVLLAVLKATVAGVALDACINNA